MVTMDECVCVFSSVCVESSYDLSLRVLEVQAIHSSSPAAAFFLRFQLVPMYIVQLVLVVTL